MTINQPSRPGLMAAATLLAGALSIGAAFAAADTGRERFPPDSAPYPSDQKNQGQGQKGAQKKKKDQKSQQQLRDEYDRARTLILSGQYETGIAAMRALDYDDNPEIANYIGYASRKLGRYDDSKYWYEKALAADPNHVRTWSYYGMWHAEQSNKLMAQEYLDKVRLICGNESCEEYIKLKGVIDGTMTY